MSDFVIKSSSWLVCTPEGGRRHHAHDVDEMERMVLTMAAAPVQVSYLMAAWSREPPPGGWGALLSRMCDRGLLRLRAPPRETPPPDAAVDADALLATWAEDPEAAPAAPSAEAAAPSAEVAAVPSSSLPTGTSGADELWGALNGRATPVPTTEEPTQRLPPSSTGGVPTSPLPTGDEGRDQLLAALRG